VIRYAEPLDAGAGTPVRTVDVVKSN
jgi:hypothetical protein